MSAAALGSFCDSGAAAEEYQLRVVLSSESATLSGIRHPMHKPIPPALIWYNQDPTTEIFARGCAGAHNGELDLLARLF